MGDGDQHAVLRATDLAGLVEHHLDVTRVLVELGGERERPLARVHLAQAAGRALGLGDQLVGDDDHVVVGQFVAV